MKKVRLKKRQIKGAMMVEFVIVVAIIFSFVVSSIEIGFALKSEGLIIGLSKNVARIVQTTGQLTQTNVDDITSKLGNEEVNDINIQVLYEDYKSSTYKPYTIGSELGYRQNFKVYIRGSYALRLASFFGHDFQFPLIYATDGTVERFKFTN